MAIRILGFAVAALLGLGAASQVPADDTTTTTTTGPEPVEFEVRHDLKYGTAGGTDLRLDAYVPDDDNAERVSVVLIHGGAWRTGDKDRVVEEATRLAERGWVVFAVNYRLDEPEVFPAAIDDVRAAVDWARENALDFRLDAGRMGALGFSAGGHLAAMLATLGEGPPDGEGRVRVAVSWSGPMDLTSLAGGEMSPLAGLLLDCDTDECPERWQEASPITHVDPTDAPMLLASGSEELVPLDQAEAMSDRLDTAGIDQELVVVPGRRHGRALRPDVWGRTVAFLDDHLTRPTNLRPENPAGTPVLAMVVVVVIIGGTLAGLRVRRRLRPPPTSPSSDTAS